MTKEQYLSWFDEVVKPTETLFRRVPADKIEFTLTEKSFTIGQQRAHIPASLDLLARVVAREKLPLNSLREILAAHRKQRSMGVNKGSNHSQGELKRSKGQWRNSRMKNFRVGCSHHLGEDAYRIGAAAHSPSSITYIVSWSCM